MLIGAASGIAYARFFRSLLPVAALGLLIDYVVISVVYRKDLARAFPGPAHPRVKVHGFLMLKGLTASAVMLAFFFAGANVSIVALTAGAALLLTRRVKSEKVFVEVNWNLLTFFAGLFVVVGAARESGLADRVFELVHARQAAVMLFMPLVPRLPEPERCWLALAMASTLAGNLTLIGSVANLIVAEGAKRASPLGFGEYLKVGVPVTLLTLTAGVLLLS
jgi:Na+/H+ antiporter NhaD/arsenite permease-like protein